MAKEPETLGYDPEVIFDVTLVTGKTYRGTFAEIDGGVPDGWISLGLYEKSAELDDRWIHLNPAFIVSVQVWLD